MCVILNLLFRVGLYTTVFSILVCYGCHNEMPRTGGLKQQKWISPQFWRQNPTIQVSAGLASSEASQLAEGHLPPVSSGRLSSVRVCVLISSFENTGHIGTGPILMISFNLTTSSQTLPPSTITF